MGLGVFALARRRRAGSVLVGLLAVGATLVLALLLGGAAQAHEGHAHEARGSRPSPRRRSPAAP